MFGRLRARLERASFPAIADPEVEARKVAVLRIATGLVMTWRCGLQLLDSYYYFDPVRVLGVEWPLQAMASAVQLALALGVTIGLRPAACAWLLLATHPAYSIWTDTYNLGPMLLTPLLGALAVLETGRLTPRGRQRAALPVADYRAVYLIIFCAYAGWSLQALLYHVRDAYWLSGQTLAVLLTNSYLSEFPDAFRAVEAAAPRFFAGLSVCVVICQSLFQAAMVPLAATSAGVRFVCWWGWVFILVSLADLQLSILPIVEVIMWTLVFVPARWFCMTADPARPAPANGDASRRAVTAALYCVSYALLLTLYVGNGLSRFAVARELPDWLNLTVIPLSGLVAPNVFNREDLSMGDRWVVLDRAGTGARGRVPFNGANGERLAYHRGDIPYFANSLRWRRGMIAAADLRSYHQPGGTGYAFARRIALYDFRRQGSVGNGLYHCTLYRNRASAVALGSDPARYEREVVYEFTVQVGPSPEAPATRRDVETGVPADSASLRR